MGSWNNVKIKYQQEQENGSLKTIVENYLIECVSFTDAEVRTYELLKEGSPDFAIVSISRVSVSDIFEQDGAEKWWHVKMAYTSSSYIGNTVKEKRIVNYMYVQADSLVDAHATLQEKLKTMLIPYEVEGIKLTPIIEVYGLKTEAPPRATE